MTILVVGGGGREHAIIKKLRETGRAQKIYCAPGNAGIAQDATCLPVAATDLQGMVAAAKEIAADLVVVTPDDPLVLGMVDAMQAAGLRAFGPNKAAARIEGSKVFAKKLMQQYGIPTAGYRRFSRRAEAMAHIWEQNQFPVVIKADGLALGKGVVIAQNAAEADAALRSMLEDKIFGESGSEVVVEEFLTGPEVSVLAFCDGRTIVPMVSAMDHKRAYDGNRGPNTGGMGTVAPNPHYTEDLAETCMQTIFLPTVRAMQAEGCPFQGCLFFGLMLTPEGPKVIEYNCRFGDPETQVVLPLLQADLLAVFEAVCAGALTPELVGCRPGAAACVVLASGGYPGGYATGVPIQGLDAAGQAEGISVYHAGTKRGADGRFVTAGGRVLGLAATGDTLPAALAAAYAAADGITFEGRQLRTDIGRY